MGFAVNRDLHAAAEDMYHFSVCVKRVRLVATARAGLQIRLYDLKAVAFRWSKKIFGDILASKVDPGALGGPHQMIMNRVEKRADTDLKSVTDLYQCGHGGCGHVALELAEKALSYAGASGNLLHRQVPAEPGGTEAISELEVFVEPFCQRLRRSLVTAARRPQRLTTVPALFCLRGANHSF